MFLEHISVDEGILGGWHVLLDGHRTELFIRWTAYSGEAELQAVEVDDYPLLLGEFANRMEALNAATDLLEHG